MRVLLRVGETHLDLALRVANEQVDRDRRVSRILMETGVPMPVKVRPGVLPGDGRALRGIPVVGARGVGGAIPGSRPGQGIWRAV